MSITSVKDKYEEQLMRLPNVVGVAIGQKAHKQVIQVLVTHRVVMSALQPHEIVPKMLDSYETDVVEIGVVSAQDSELARKQ